jgi:hypothetical protein
LFSFLIVSHDISIIILEVIDKIIHFQYDNSAENVFNQIIEYRETIDNINIIIDENIITTWSLKNKLVFNFNFSLLFVESKINNNIIRFIIIIDALNQVNLLNAFAFNSGISEEFIQFKNKEKKLVIIHTKSNFFIPEKFTVLNFNKLKKIQKNLFIFLFLTLVLYI